MPCAVCLGPIRPPATIYCSRACYGQAMREAAAIARRAIVRQCRVCGEDFTPPRNSSRETCSKACRYRAVSENHKAAGVRPTSPPSPDEQRARLLRDAAPWWTGGKRVTPQGYVITLAPLDFPYPEMCSAHGRIREHRMVMALHLGRGLARHEVVHHINGDRGDNRIENLELFESHAAHMRHHASAR